MKNSKLTWSYDPALGTPHDWKRMMLQSREFGDKVALNLARRFGLLAYSEMVNSETTHLVCGQTKRTINLLKALLRGCWILTKVNFP